MMNNKLLVKKFLLVNTIFAIFLILPNFVFAAQLLINDGSANYTDTGWTPFAGQGYLNDVHYTAAGSGSQTATWTPTIASAGFYKVYASWSTYSNRATNAPYTVNSVNGTSVILVNQQLLSDQSTIGGVGQWSGLFYLGTYYFNAGTSGNVVLSNNANNYVIADAVSFNSTIIVSSPSTITVCSSGCNYTTIQAAVNAAHDGDTIQVSAGTYNENQIIINTPLSVIGAGPDTTNIDGSDATLTSDGLIRIIASTGNVTFSGFTVKNAGGPTNSGDGNDGKTNVGIFAQSSAAGSYYTISNNVILGTTNANDQEDYGLYANSGKESLIFVNNTIAQTGANPILVEINPGPTDISYNILDVGLGPSDAIFSMTYGGVNVTTLQKVSHNAIDVGTGNPGRAAAISFMSSYSGSGPLGDGKYTNIQITDNTISNVGNDRRGLGLYNDANGDGSGGEISSAIITGNTIIGISGSTPNFGIRLAGLVTNTTVANNNITNTDKAFYGTTSRNGDHYPSGIIIRNNSFANSVYGIFLDAFANSTITGNNIFGNSVEGVQLNAGSDAIINITISNNVVYNNNRHGILFAGNSNNNTITGNTVYNNTYAQIALWSPSSPFPSNNMIYLNRIFKGSAPTSYTAGDWGIGNSWNATSAPNSGNFWSDLSTNPGYLLNPVQYNILQGSAGSIDYHPMVPSIVYVDPSYTSSSAGGHTFGFNAFNKIQDGIDAVVVGGSVIVNPGTYTEQLVVNKNLTLSGAGNTTTIIKAPSVLVGDTDGFKNIMTITGSNVNVDFSGFTVSGPGPSGCGSINTGIFVRNGAYSNIHNNVISSISDNPLSGCQNGQGIYVGKQSFSTTGSATISNNVIINYQKGGIVIDNTGSSATISGNIVSGVGVTLAIAQNGIQISRGATAIVSNNVISGNWFNYTGHSGCVITTSETIWDTCDMSAGILIFSTNNVANSGNQIQSNQIGVYISGSNNVVNKDKIFNSQYGVGIDGNSNFVIANAIYNNTHGIWITGSSNNITQNNVTNNVGATGIHLTSTSHNNIIYNNVFANNIPQAVDYGTHNLWNTSTTGNVWSDLYSNPGSPAQYRINQPIGSIDYHPIIPLSITKVSLSYPYLRVGQAQYVDVYTSDPYGVSQGKVIVEDNGNANHTANVLTSNKLFRALFSATTLGTHTLRIYVTDNIGFVDSTKTLTFYVEPSSVPVPTLIVTPTQTLHSGTVTLKLVFDRLMDTSSRMTVTIKGPSGTASINGNWISSTVWQGTYTVTSLRNGQYTLTAVNTKDLTGHSMNPFYQYAFTKT